MKTIVGLLLAVAGLFATDSSRASEMSISGPCFLLDGKSFPHTGVSFPLLGLMNTEQNDNVREEAVGILRNFTDDPAVVFEACDEFDDPATKAPLVHGLQDANPLVREEAADAFSRHASDPAVRQWLEYVASNDADLRVRREDREALQERPR